MAAKTEMIHARVDPKLKKSTEGVFSLRVARISAC
jgi:hypothetical protein